MRHASPFLGLSVIVALLTVAGCATTPPEGPRGTCPGDIEAAPPLGEGFGRDARTWVKNAGPMSVGSVLGAPRKFVEATADLAVGRVTVLGVSADAIGALVLREVEPGACVVNSFSTYLTQTTDLAEVTGWTAKDKKTAVFLLEMADTADPEAPSRWVVLGTDGKKVWPALSGPGGFQVTALRAMLRPRGGSVLLDVQISNATVHTFRLGKDGIFVPFR